jgi:branched-chain amino acid transport system permease protein
MARMRGKIRVDYGLEIALVKNRGQWLSVGLLLALLVIFPFIIRATGNSSWLTWMCFTFLTIIAALGVNVTTGMAGQVNMGQAAFVLVGGYAQAMLTTLSGWSFWAALPLAAVITGLLGLAVGAPSARLKGFYLAVATFAFFFIAQYVLKHWDLAGGNSGLISIPPPYIGPFAISTDFSWYWVLLALTLFSIFVSANLNRSRLGRAFYAVRDNDRTAASMGINVYATKLRAFFIGAVFGGFAGALWVSFVTVVRADMFTMWDSIWYLAMVIIGGAGATGGTILGVLFLRLVSQLLHTFSLADWGLPSAIWTPVTYGVYGLSIILFVMFQPYGLYALWRKLKARYQRWPFA